MGSRYEYSSSPQALSARRSRKPGQEGSLFRQNEGSIVRDPRVEQVQERARWLRSANPHSDESIRSLLREALRTPVDISANLIEQTESVTVKEIESQTSEFLPRPQTPKYVPKKTGVDRGTQIEEEDHLFDFDKEVEPILDILVSKTLEQSMLEVQQEEEMAHLAKSKTFFLGEKAKLREKEQERERQQIEKWKLKEKMVKREKKRLARQVVLCEKVAAWHTFREEIGDSLKKVVFERLEGSDLFPNETKVAVEDVFLPWVVEQVSSRIDRLRLARNLADELIASALELRRSKALQLRQDIVDRKAHEAERKRLAEVAAAQERQQVEREKEKNKKSINIFLRGIEVLGEEHLGPIKLSLLDTVTEAEAKIEEWLCEQGKDVSKPEGGFLRLALRLRDGEEGDGGEAAFSPGDDPNMTLEFLQDLNSEGEEEKPVVP